MIIYYHVVLVMTLWPSKLRTPASFAICPPFSNTDRQLSNSRVP
jgi:hypothetical protein